MDRRQMMRMSVTAGVGVALGRPTLLNAVDKAATVTIVQYSDAGVRGEAVSLPKIVKAEGEWRRQLSAISFEVTRREATERPFTGATWNNHDKGIYRCVCCDTALFSSTTKFESGTGWPSFWQPLDKRNIATHTDTSLRETRTAVT
ncbi:MAG TPA: peptide-methionine (R)-S-oxide reductase, partial [Vicinamibacterales bacterium]|nr:peptide-methionine (R)-S-oxide reductase [Vicinamibacterales bacterium]